MILVAAILCTLLGCYVTVRSGRKERRLLGLVEQRMEFILKMTEAIQDGDLDKHARYYQRSQELGELIDREIEKV